MVVTGGVMCLVVLTVLDAGNVRRVILQELSGLTCDPCDANHDLHWKEKGRRWCVVVVVSGRYSRPTGQSTQVERTVKQKRIEKKRKKRKNTKKASEMMV